MRHCAAQLEDLRVPWEAQAISAHRAPDTLDEYLSSVAGARFASDHCGGGRRGPICRVFARRKLLCPCWAFPIEIAIRSTDWTRFCPSWQNCRAGFPVGTLAIGKPGRHQRGLAGGVHSGREISGTSQGLRRIPSPTDRQGDRGPCSHAARAAGRQAMIRRRVRPIAVQPADYFRHRVRNVSRIILRE